MNINKYTDCILITNPAHDYAREFIKRAKRMYHLPIVGIFSLKWRYEDFLSRFTDLAQQMHFWICIYDQEDEAEKVRKVQRRLDEQRLHARMIIPWDDSSILIAARLSEALRLPWLTYEQALPFKDKYVLKKYLSEHTSLRVNRFALASSTDEVLAFQRDLNKWPIVLKPVSAGGSWNVFVVHDDEDARIFSNNIIGVYNEYDRTYNATLLVEEYVEGMEFSVDGQTDVSGNIVIGAVYQEEKCLRDHLYPVYLDSYLLNPRDARLVTIIDYIAEVIRSCRLINSPFHAELKEDQEGICLMEVACRPSGGGILFLSSGIMGVDFFDLATKGYSGNYSVFERVSVLKKPPDKYGAVVQGVSVTDGHVSRIEGLDALKQDASLMRIDHIPSIGEVLYKTVNFDTVQYVIHLSAASRAKIQEKAHWARSQLKIFCEDRLNSQLDC